MSKYILVLGSSVGVVGVAGVSYWKLSSNQEIKASLKERFKRGVSGRVLLDSVGDKHDSVWGQLAKEYKETYKDSVGALGLSDIDKDKIKDYCKSNSKSTEEGKFESYVEWCSRNTLRTQFNDKVSNKTWIDSKEQADWKDKATNYPNDNTGNLQIPKSDASSGTIGKSEVTWEKIMNWCAPQTEIPFLNAEDVGYKRAESLCTK
ncbi:hypothetical protein MHC_03345 [Mycoplasma haemocanis str. Illinois]|uniref:Uncharacterized protein n=1 Tax=Mycoplasma haemocanis (strain Illinois) TaxID=1111676 RepID=H6N7A7_MYCHN|nr:hypothetical protein [Mycoplasma haemocanis]AEW45529.1 hypothetical protein MHC_03345 [Mycoplasma haemocanis str. Illinois]